MTPTEADPSTCYLQDQVTFVTMMLDLRARATRNDDAILALAAIKARIATIEAVHADLPALALSHRLALSHAEQGVVWLLVAIASSPDARRFAAAIDDGGGVDPTLETIRSIVYGATFSAQSLRELGPEGTLRRLGVIERSDGGGRDVHDSRWSWAISRRVLGLLHGDRSVDSALARISRAHDVVDIANVVVAPEVLASARTAMKASNAIVAVSGAPGLGRRTLLAAVAREATIDILEIDAAKLAKDPALLRDQLNRVARECKLLAKTPLIANVDALGEHAEAVGELAAEVAGLMLVTTGPRRPAMRWGRPVIAIEMPAPTSAQRAQLGRAALDAGTTADAERLATEYPLAPSVIHHAAQAARVRAVGRTLEADDIHAGIRAALDDRLGDFARRVTVTQTWDDVVLPVDQFDQVIELVARIRQRSRVYEQWGFAAKVGKGLGVSALFSGPPGTGKTMVAALVARELGLELYQVDIAHIVSKWIGETEKQLAALFDAAEAGHAVLLFDEADALFGKRTDVKSSNDRYANLETNYLLQRLETFTGVCILTSNHEGSIDPAFQRRLSLHLRFDVPDVAERSHLWRAMLPAAAPVDGKLDFGRLAGRYEMSGGHIRNAVLRAAFLAADNDGVITFAHLERAARLELEGMGKIAA